MARGAAGFAGDDNVDDEHHRRFGAAIQNARRAAQSERMLNRLPPEIQKDIGWPAPEHGRRHATLAIYMSPDR